MILIGIVFFLISLIKGNLVAASIFFVAISILWCFEEFGGNDDES